MERQEKARLCWAEEGKGEDAPMASYGDMCLFPWGMQYNHTKDIQEPFQITARMEKQFSDIKMTKPFEAWYCHLVVTEMKGG